MGRESSFNRFIFVIPMKAKAEFFIINSIFSIETRFYPETPTSSNTPPAQLLNMHQKVNIISSRNPKGWKQNKYHTTKITIWQRQNSDLAKTARLAGRNNQTQHVIPSPIRKKGNTNPILPLYKKYITWSSTKTRKKQNETTDSTEPLIRSRYE